MIELILNHENAPEIVVMEDKTVKEVDDAWRNGVSSIFPNKATETAFVQNRSNCQDLG